MAGEGMKVGRNQIKLEPQSAQRDTEVGVLGLVGGLGVFRNRWVKMRGRVEEVKGKNGLSNFLRITFNQQ